MIIRSIGLALLAACGLAINELFYVTQSSPSHHDWRHFALSLVAVVSGFIGALLVGVGRELFRSPGGDA